MEEHWENRIEIAVLAVGRRSSSYLKAEVMTNKPRKISDMQAVILSLLIDGTEKYGLQMIKESNKQLKRSGIYVVLDRMEDYGLIESKLKDPEKGKQGPARRVYRITGEGKSAFEEKIRRVSSILDGLSGAS